MKRVILSIMVICLCVGLCACGKSQEARNVDEKINAIGTVTLESGEAITSAEDAYSALSDEAKAEVANNIITLTNARIQYDELVKELTKQKIAEDSQKRIDSVATQIDSIGTVSLASSQTIVDAELAFERLPKEEQDRVGNYEKLTKAKEELQNLRTAAINEAIKLHKDKFKITVDKVDNYSVYLPKNNPKYSNSRSYISAGVALKNNNAQLFVVYNYTGDDWVFFNQLTIVVDGVQYNKTVSNVSRQVGWGDVVERYIEQLSFGKPTDSEEINLLFAIANSKETIVRFRGSEGSYDLKVKQQDKDMLKDVLALYSACVD